MADEEKKYGDATGQPNAPEIDSDDEEQHDYDEDLGITATPAIQKMMDADDKLLIPSGNGTCGTPLAACVGAVTCPCCFVCSFFTNPVNTTTITTHCGEFSSEISEPGCYFSNCCGRNMYQVSTKQTSLNLPLTKVLDMRGNPLLVSAVLIFKIVNPKRAIFTINQRENFIRNAAMLILRNVVARYPYETPDDSPSLKSHLNEITQRMTKMADQALVLAGADAISFQLNEISYAPEIAGAMLKVQQASALVDARAILIEGVTSVVLDALEELKKNDMELTDDEAANLVSSLLLVTSSDAATVNTINVGLPM